ncbi:MAG: 50S ribosomal protein L9 [Eggerthellaceae bacterium]|nr:50S ribosomal protein L9 [Eggerthellaceae bacterium]
MKIILLDELPGKGGEGDVVDVAPGHFNNYLGPQGKAVLATKGNLKQLEQRRGNIAKREQTRIAKAEELKAALEGQNVKVQARVGEENILFGSVTAQMIVDAVKDQLGIDLDRKRLVLRKAIKVAGSHEVEYSIYRDIKSVLTLKVDDFAVKGNDEEDAEEVENTSETQTEAPAEEVNAEDAAGEVEAAE